MLASPTRALLSVSSRLSHDLAGDEAVGVIETVSHPGADTLLPLDGEGETYTLPIVVSQCGAASHAQDNTVNRRDAGDDRAGTDGGDIYAVATIDNFGRIAKADETRQITRVREVTLWPTGGEMGSCAAIDDACMRARATDIGRIAAQRDTDLFAIAGNMRLVAAAGEAYPCTTTGDLRAVAREGQFTMIAAPAEVAV